MKANTQKIFLSGSVVIFLSFTLIFFAAGCGKKKKQEAKKTGVMLTMPKFMKFQNRIRLQGNIEPKEYALICAKTDGTIDVMDVDEGDRVKPGQILFQSDKLNLESLLEVARKNLKVEESKAREAEANLMLSEAKLKKAMKDYDRNKRLLDVKAISDDNFEKVELSLREAHINFRIAATTVNSAKTQVEKAESNLTIAQKYYDDSQVRALFPAVVTKRYKEPGEYAKQADCIVRLENPDRLELTLLLSSKYYIQVVPGKTKVLIYSETGKKYKETFVTYKSPTIDLDSRTFEIKIDLREKNSFVSGMLCDVDIILEENKGYGVPNDAVMVRGEGRVLLFTVKDEKAEELPVTPGISDKGYTQIRNFTASNLVPVVVQGQAFLNDGALVKVVNGQEQKEKN